MKIFYLSNSIIPSCQANSFQVMKMCEAFVQAGQDVTLFGIRGSGRKADIWEHYGLSKRFTVQRMRRLPFGRTYDCSLRSALRAIRGRPDWVFCRDIVAGTLTAKWGIPTIVELHHPTHGRWLLRLIFRAKGLRKIVLISDALKRILCAEYEDFPPDEKVLVLPDAVNPEQFATLPTPPQARQICGLAEAPTVGYAGHFYPGRGIELILEIARSLQQYHFVLIGGYAEDVQRFSRQTRGERLSNVQFAGFIPNPNLPMYLAACDVLLMPYQQKTDRDEGCNTCRWMSPMKMFEYMAAGRAIISSDLPVLHEVLNKTNSVFCNPTDVQEWTEAVKNILDAAPLREALAARAQKDVKQYTWIKRAERIIEQMEMER